MHLVHLLPCHVDNTGLKFMSQLKFFQALASTEIVWRLEWRCTIREAQALGCREEREAPEHGPLEALGTQSHLA